MANPTAPANLDELDPMGLTSHSRSRSHHSIPNPEGTAEPTHEYLPQLEPKGGESQQHLHPQVGGGPIPPAPQSLGGVGPEGDYGPEPTTSERIQENFFLVVTLGLAAAFWLMALISQAIVTAEQSNATIRTAWFALVLQLLLIVLTIVLLLTTYLPPYHIQLSTLASIVIVFGAIAVDNNIFSPHTAAQSAVSAAWLVTVLIDLIWVLYFTSPPQSPLVAIVSGIGPVSALDTKGGFGGSAFAFGGRFGGPPGVEGPGAYSTHRQSRAMSQHTGPPNVNVELGSIGGGNRHSTALTNNRLSNIPESGQGSMSGVGSGYNRNTQATVGLAGPVAGGPVDESRPRSGWSLGGLVGGRKDKEKARTDKESSDLGVGSRHETPQGVPIGPSSGGGSAVGSRPVSQRVVARAEAMYNYHASSEDPGELPFKKGEMLDILDRSGKWWEARRADGRAGIVPSNYLRVVEQY
ncbi:hypothetical protein EST38_g4502 [Candolleomyces aberdarensis]|uniref:SH3 domain-containing protein n=1 Tax=Candolleomyces aberdarensis TaxID=2316362 RepID=A0A4Q2DQ86_9AGAR|nr:hypothetical protein EST38_g4502 [Candolleomyces aberdarensis]